MGNYIAKKILKKRQNFKSFSLEGLKTNCKIISVYDGDTCTIGFIRKGEFFQTKVRMLGYDSPEMKPKLSVPNRDKEIAAAKKAKQFLIDLTQDKIIWVEFGKFDKYGRPLATLFIKNNIYCCMSTEININELMVEKGHGYRYDGGTKKKVNY